MARGSMDDQVAALLRGFGVASASKGDEVRRVVREELDRRGVAARVVELRYGRLVLAAAAVHARLLTFDRDQILAVLEDAVPGEVRQIVVRSER